MVELNTKCPKCGEGIMKLPPNPVPLSPMIPPAGKARCTKCDFEDDAEIKGKK